MINYNPIDGDVYSKRIKYRPRTCFIMTKLGKPIPKEIINMRRTVAKYLKNYKIEIIDASSIVTGRDFLVKIFEMILSVPLGIALISKKFNYKTIANIFYEIGLLQALGKETLIIKTEGSNIPSDFIRTEYIEYNNKIKEKISEYLKTYFELAEHYELLGCELIKNPITSIDYLKRSYLMTSESNTKDKINKIISSLFSPEHFTEEIKKNIKNLITS
jgi:hypothetical protein